MVKFMIIISNSADVKVFASLNIFPSPRLCKVKGGGGRYHTFKICINFAPGNGFDSFPPFMIK